MPSLPNSAFLLWTSDFGAGHRQTALALAQALEEMDPGGEIEVMDVRQMLHPRLYPLLKAGYRLTLEQLPVLFGQADRYPLSVSGWYGPRVQLARLRFKALLSERSWQAIISTTGYAAMVMASFRRSGALNAPVATVITDFYAHPYWIHPGTDLYIVGHDAVLEGLRTRGVPRERIVTTGIPIHPAFESAAEKREASRRSEQAEGGSTRPLRLILMGGGWGLFQDLDRLLGALDRSRIPLHLWVLTGRNAELQKALSARPVLSPHAVQALGYLPPEAVADLFAVSDGLITKPGGVTLAEALAVGVPMFLVHALPGPEEENARLFVSLGLAETGDEHALVRWAEKLADPTFHEAWLTRAKPHRPKEAARAAAKAVLRLIPTSSC